MKETHLRVLWSSWSYRSPSIRAVQTREGLGSNLDPRFRVQGIFKIRSLGFRAFPELRFLEYFQGLGYFQGLEFGVLEDIGERQSLLEVGTCG
jgi:hypothetical protein